MRCRPLSTVQELPETPPPETPPPRPPPPVLFPTPIKDDFLKNIPEIPKDDVQMNITTRPPKLYQLVQLSQDQDESFDFDDFQSDSLFFGEIYWISFKHCTFLSGNVPIFYERGPKSENLENQ